MKYFHFITYFFLIGFILFLLLLIIDNKYDFNNSHSFQSVSFQNNGLEFSNQYFEIRDSTDLFIDGQKYLNDVNFLSPINLDQHIAYLDSVNGVSINNQIYLSTILTDTLKQYIWKSENLDTLLFIANWSSKVLNYSEHSKNDRFFKVISDYWLSECSNKIKEYQEKENYNVKTSFKVEHMKQILASNGYNSSITETKLHKILKYTYHGEFKYLFIRFWYSTNFLIKFVFILILIVPPFLIYKTLKK